MIVSYNELGAKENLAAMKEVFSVDEYVEALVFGLELSRLLLDARCAIEGKDIAFLEFWNCAGGSLGR